MDPDKARMTAVLSTVMLVAVQAGLGCTVTVGDIRDNLSRPLAVALGLFAQIVFMPLIAYGLAMALRMQGDDLLGIALVACTPGGSMSNVFSYFARGNMALSITLTVLSNVLAFGTMPLAILLLARDSTVPFAGIVKTLALTIVPTLFGIALKTLRPTLAHYGEKLGAGIGAIAVVGSIISGITANAKKFGELEPALFISTALLGALGMLAAYLLAVVFRVHGSRRITLCIETGVQNLALTMALIALSFDNKFSIVVYSYIFGFVICIECAVFSAFARWSTVRMLLCGVDPSEVNMPQVLPKSIAVADVEMLKAPTAHAPLLKA